MYEFIYDTSKNPAINPAFIFGLVMMVSVTIMVILSHLECQEIIESHIDANPHNTYLDRCNCRLCKWNRYG